MVTRRQFLKAGIVGGAALAALGAWYWSRKDTGRVSGPAFKLDVTGYDIVAALVPAILAGALPQDDEHDGRTATIDRVVNSVELTIAGLGAAAQEEIRQLFALLGFAPTRVLLGGLVPAWREASVADVSAFLQRWRFSRLALLRSAYAALHDLVLGAWYANDASWAAIGYPGPPEVS